MADDPTTTGPKQATEKTKDYEYVREAWSWALPLKSYFEWIETSHGGVRHLTVYLVFECQGRRSESCLIDEDVTDDSSFQCMMMVDALGESLEKNMPEWVIECAVEKVAQAGEIAVRESPHIPPRHNSDWSHPKLFNAVALAADAVPAHKRITQANVVEVINRRYKLKRPLTTDGLRMLLKRHGVDWKEIKRRFGKKRTPQS